MPSGHMRASMRARGDRKTGAMRAAALLLLTLRCAAEEAEEYHRYIVIGSGPGGLQMAHFLQSAGRDYLLLEAGDEVASFFRTYPRFRQLISINKRYTGSFHADFSYRHDWNSLLAEPSHSGVSPCRPPGCVQVPLSSANPGVAAQAQTASSSDDGLDVRDVPPAWRFTSYSSEYYPRADDLVRYLQCFAQPQAGTSGACVSESAERLGRANTTFIRGDLHIRFRTRIASVERRPVDDAAGAFAQRFHLVATDGRRFACAILLYAGGLNALMPATNPALNNPAVAGTYMTASSNVSDYTNRRVLLIGRGNAAFEFAHNIMRATAYTHVMGRPSSRIRLSWETHYTGDVRMVHALLLEAYLLKSQDAMMEADTSKLRFQLLDGPDAYALNAGSDQHATPVEVSLPFSGMDLAAGADADEELSVFRSETYVYDNVIVFLGWRFNSSIFGPSAHPLLGRNGKHPDMTPFFESRSVPGLYFAGALMHGNDFKRSSGGFIHGFRYLVRALHRRLEELEAAGAASAADETAAPARAWPRRPLHGLLAVRQHVQRRVNRAGGIFQMFGQLVDVLLLQPVNGAVGDGAWDPASSVRPALRDAIPADAGVVGEYFEEVPLGAVPDRVAAWSHAASASAPQFIAVSLEFGPGGEEEFAAVRKRATRATPPQAASSAPSAMAQPPLHDPFSLKRVNGTVDAPEGSVFLHPVLRYWDYAVSTKAPVLVQHLMEDFYANFSSTFRHAVPLARFLLHVAESRLLLAAGAHQPSLLAPAVAAREESEESRSSASLARAFWRLPWRRGLFHGAFAALASASSQLRLLLTGDASATFAAMAADAHASMPQPARSRGALHGFTARWRGERFTVGDGWTNLLPMASSSGRWPRLLRAVVVFESASASALVAGNRRANATEVAAAAEADAAAMAADRPDIMFIGVASSVLRHSFAEALVSACNAPAGAWPRHDAYIVWSATEAASPEADRAGPRVAACHVATALPPTPAA